MQHSLSALVCRNHTICGLRTGWFCTHLAAFQRWAWGGAAHRGTGVSLGAARSRGTRRGPPTRHDDVLKGGPTSPRRARNSKPWRLTLQPPEVGGVEGGHGVGDPGRPADARAVDGPHAERVRAAFAKPRHGVPADLHGGVIALQPVVGPHFAPSGEKGRREGRAARSDESRGSCVFCARGGSGHAGDELTPPDAVGKPPDVRGGQDRAELLVGPGWRAGPDPGSRPPRGGKRAPERRIRPA